MHKKSRKSLKRNEKLAGDLKLLLEKYYDNSKLGTHGDKARWGLVSCELTQFSSNENLKPIQVFNVVTEKYELLDDKVYIRVVIANARGGELQIYIKTSSKSIVSQDLVAEIDEASLTAILIEESIFEFEDNLETRIALIL